MTASAAWISLEDATWNSIPSLGPEWMGKSSASDEGFALMLTNGCGIWGESRTSSYVQEKADEWAPCIEAGIKELGSLVLDEIKKLNMKAHWKDERKTVTLHISSRLNDLSFKWIFSLNRLSDELFREHWVIPQVIQIHHMGSRIKQLTTELKKKTQQLEELMPENTNNKNATKPKKKEVPLDASVEAVMVEGSWTVLQDHLVNFPNIMRQLAANRTRDFTKTEPETKKGRLAEKKRAEKEMNEEAQRIEKEKEQERRAQIQEMQQGTPLPPTQTKKKKKKLNI